MILDEFGNPAQREDETFAKFKTPDWLIREGLEALQNRVGVATRLFGPTLYDANGRRIEQPLTVEGKPFTSPLSIRKK